MFMCDRYLTEHGKSKKVDRLILVEEIKDEAHRDHGQALAQARYLNDLRAGSAAPSRVKPLPFQPTKTPISQHLTPGALRNAQELSSMRDQDLKPMAALKLAIDIIREAGLTEAEIAAVQTFTANDYLYINPAIMQKKPEWLASQMGQIQHGMNMMSAQGGTARTSDAAKLNQEGVTHAGVMMQGLAKMRPMKGLVYRGARMSAKEFRTTYASKTQITYDTFVSSATETKPARGYANGGGSKSPRPDQTISVFCVFEVDDARNIQPLSMIPHEKEWLLLPGATFQITKIEDDPDMEPGKDPTATKGKLVHLKQIPRPPYPATAKADDGKGKGVVAQPAKPGAPGGKETGLPTKQLIH